MALTRHRILIGSEKIPASAINYTDLDTNTKRTTREIRIPADSAAEDTWARPALFASVPVKIVDAGIIPESAFGQSGDNAIITLTNKRTTGVGTLSIVAKTFSTAVSGHVYTSFGTITSGDVASGETVSFDKTCGLSGEIVPASILVLNVERAA